jgi:signal transduction histidine kinase
MKRLRELAEKYWFDGVILVVLGFGLAAAVLDQKKVDGPEGPLWFDILAVVGWTIPLFARRRFPVGCMVAAGVVVAGSTFVDSRLVSDNFTAYLAGLAISVLFGMRPSRTQSIGGLALTIAASAIVVWQGPNHGGDLVWDAITFSIAWTVGFALGGTFRVVDEAKEQADAAEREREAAASRAVAEERSRIARELHDVVGHSVSVMTVQASAVRRLLEDDQEKEREALLVVEQTGREALAEMRRMVGVLRRPEEAPALAPQPSLEHIDKLVAHAREAGLPVQVRIEGTPEQLPAGIDLTAYRLVQEGLTNALKHARAGHAEIVIRYGDGHVELTISDDGTGDGDGHKGGHGLVGMRERVSLYGGELEAGPKAGGGFRLRARLPVT